jgi:hypothetical protein
MILEEKKTGDIDADLLPGQYLLRLRRRLGGRNLNAIVVGFQDPADAHPCPDWRFDVMTRGGSPVR